MAEKSHVQPFRRIDKTTGQMMTIGNLVIVLGGWEWPTAIIGARQIALKRARMGGKWANIHEQSETPTFLRLKS